MDHGQMSDDELMTLISKRNSDAFDVLHKRWKWQVRGYLRHQRVDHHTAEDLVQEIFSKVYSRASQYVPQGRFVHWLMRLSRRLLIDHIRHQRSRSQDQLILSSDYNKPDANDLEVADKLAYATGVADNIITNELKEAVLEALDSVPDDQRDTFLLYAFSGFSLPEVSQQMGCTTSTSKSRLRLAREKITEFMFAHRTIDLETVKNLFPDMIAA